MSHLANLLDELIGSIQQRHTIHLEALGFALEGRSYLLLQSQFLLLTHSIIRVHGFAYLSWYLR